MAFSLHTANWKYFYNSHQPFSHFWKLINALKIPYDYEQLPGGVAKCSAGLNCLSRKDPTRKFPHNPACRAEGNWGMATWVFS